MTKPLEYRNFRLFDKKNIILYLFIFIFIYTPFIIPWFNVIHILALISYFFLLTVFKDKLIDVFKLKVFRVFIFVHITLIIYTLILGLSSDNYGNTYYAVSTIIEVLPVCLFITFYLQRFKITYTNFLEIILLMGVVQFIFVAGSVLSPDIRDLTLTYFPKGGNFERVFTILGEFRMFGLTRYYTFSMPLFMGICLIISFVLGSQVNKKYFLLIPFYLFSIVVNARIALIALPIVFGVLFFIQIRQNFFKQMMGVIAAGIILFFAILFIEMKAAESYNYNVWTWLDEGFSEIRKISQGEKSGNMKALTDKMWIFPEKIDLLFGTGEDIFIRRGMNSDIGYVLNLYYGGLIYCALLYGVYIKFLSSFNRNDKIQKIIFVSIILFLFLANFKGTVFRTNEVIHGTLLIGVFTILYNFNKTEDNSEKNEDYIQEN